jgi:sugar phosphate isomerase/epimerase
MGWWREPGGRAQGEKMCFGIMTLQQEALIPSGMSIDEAAAAIARFDHADLARDLYGLGFDTLELSGDMSLFLPHSFSQQTVERLAELKAETGLAYTVHLPLWSVELSTPLEPVREGSVRVLIDLVRATRPLAPECYVLHATGALASEFYQRKLPEPANSFILGQFQARARESVRAILAGTGLDSRQLAIETIEFPLDMTLALAEELDLSLCLDTGHVLAGFSGPVDLFEALDRCLPRLAEIHLHDCPWVGRDGEVVYGQDHQALGKGDLDVARLLDWLEAAAFAGPLILELTVQEALASLELIRDLRPEALA